MIGGGREHPVVELGQDGDDRQAAQAGDDLRLAAGPATESLEDTGRLDDVALKEPLQVVGKRLGRGIAVLGHLLEAFQADGLELTGNVRDKLVGRHRIALEDLDDGLHHARRVERRPAAQQLVEDGPQAIDVGRRRRSICDAPQACSGAM